VGDVGPLTGLSNLGSLSFWYSELSDLSPLASMVGPLRLYLENNPLDCVSIAAVIPTLEAQGVETSWNQCDCDDSPSCTAGPSSCGNGVVDAPFESWDQMDAARKRLSSRADAGPDFKAMQKKYQRVEEQLTYKMKSNDFKPPYEEDAFANGVIGRALGQETGMTPEQLEPVDELIEMMQSASSEYFEAKPMRAVKLDEFGTALVPEDSPKSVLDVLAKQGLKVQKYNTAEHRAELLSEQKELFFQYLMGLTGGGAAAGATHKMISQQRAGEDKSVSGLGPLLPPT
jgi:hypothetical protein